MNIHSLPINIVILLVSALVITRSIKIFISTSTKLAQLLKISEYTISFLLVAVATSLPELMIGIQSGINKTPILSYGNAIGSNLALITLIVALPVLFGHSISTKNIIRSNDIYHSAFFLILALAMALDGVITKIDGIILIVGYLYHSKSILKRGTAVENLLDTFKRERTNVWKESVLFVFSFALLLASSQGIVNSAIALSSGLNISLAFVGLTITAIGTSLPEIAFVMGIMYSGDNKDKIMGDILGGVLTNSTLVLGVTAVICPIDLQTSHFGFSTILIILATLLLFLAFSKTDEKIDKREAITLLIIYVVFVSLEYYLSS